ncbi:uncharacterized protein N0V89_001533 [Didymosphaeria variabile]|uniref:Glycosyl transferase CAP10 domain-containing protein n=1 Tax=Didymosphaeria variabile TaxID=1932322 RepID=A0A9W9CGS0_9PLEO|nr:uncharacterized protein N0V89_001533 [Didymosphaeria variabile]KAJ4360964.1 hypothetical protein N0V89_001533 [Didymosphaeria variabile]
MHPTASSIADYARRNHHVVVPLLFSVLAATANVHAPVQHQLLIASVSWAAICIPTLFRAGLGSPDAAKRKTHWLAGGFLALSHICERAACDKEGTWSTKGLLPLLAVFLSGRGGLFKHLALPTHASSTNPAKESAAATEQQTQSPSVRILAVITLSASLALVTGFTASSTFALGISSVIFAAVGFVLFESALKSSSDDETFLESSQVPINRNLMRPGSGNGLIRREQFVVLRDVAVVMALVCGLAAYLMEPPITSSTISWEPVYRFGGDSVKTVRHYQTVQLVLVLILVNTLLNALIFLILIDSAEKDFRDLLGRQSKSLGEAVIEYRRRNGITPPPYFDKWYEFATRNGVVLIDEFDTITQTLLPYWSLKPSTIRSRIRNALGNEDSALIAILIRDGSIAKAEGEPDWQRNATAGMMEKFVQYLPDMDLGFNIHDEPRVVVPNDHLSAMVAKAQEVLFALAKKDLPKNSFSPRPSDVSSGKRIEEVSYSRFNRFAHQQTWTHSRLSCPARSQAQQFEDQVVDNLTAYAAGPLNYVLNQTAFTDICNSPSFSGSYGFFERPNAFSVVHELTPIFSQSKISSFQDILYPSPWYWYGKVGYDDWHDTSWENKTNSLYWRGSTTGGFSRKGGWRRQHRQRIVRRLNALDKANISVPVNNEDGTSSVLAHQIQEVDRTLYKPLIDVKFSHIGQCDPGDCDAQREFFYVAEHADGQDAWYYKHLLDMDGNAFSGRFYSFLKSRSLTYKMAVFREWHNEWLRPWVHYIPFSLIGDEHLDLVRWFSGVEVKKGEGEKKEADKGGNGDSLGEKKAREIAERSTEWSGKALRNVDFEAWLFRLLLEYGRVIDDDRENIGYPGP